MAAVIDSASELQSIDGFGAGVCSLEQAPDALWDKLFLTSGLGLSIAREYIDPSGHFNDGTHNAGPSPYPPGLDLPNALKVRDRGARFMAFAQWEPPEWASETTGNRIAPARYAEWASRYATFLQQATDNGITIEAIAAGNEPDGGSWGLLFSASELRAFNDHLKAAIAGSSQPGCKIMLGEMGVSSTLASYVDAFRPDHLGDVGYFSHHDYGQTPANPNIPGKNLWQTEASNSTSGPYWAQRIDTYLRAGASAYLYLYPWAPQWYTFSSGAGLLGFYNAGSPAPSKRACIFAQYARWLRPGDVRVAVSGGPSGVGIVAAKRPNGHFSVVLTNYNGTDTPVDLAGLPDVASLQRWETRSNTGSGEPGTAGNVERMADVVVSGGTATITVPATSTVTLTTGIGLTTYVLGRGDTAILRGEKDSARTVTVDGEAATSLTATTWEKTVALAPGVNAIPVSDGVTTEAVEVQGPPVSASAYPALTVHASAVGSPVAAGGALVAETGTIAAVGLSVRRGAAEVDNVGVPATAGARVAYGAALVPGVATITAAGPRVGIGAASIAAAGTIAASGFAVGSAPQGTAVVTGAGAIAVAGERVMLGDARVTGAGDLAALGHRTAQGATLVSGAVSLEAAGIRVGLGTTFVEGYGQVAVIGELPGLGIVIVTGEGQILIVGERVSEGSTLVTGVGVITAASELRPPAVELHARTHPVGLRGRIHPVGLRAKT